jgi:hypothetical protein
LLGYTKEKWPYVLVGCIASGIHGATQPVVSILFAELFALYYRPAEEIRENSWKFSLGYVGIAFVVFFAIVFQFSMFSVSCFSMIKKLRGELFQVTFQLEKILNFVGNVETKYWMVR